jgi:hypothetical protein
MHIALKYLAAVICCETYYLITLKIWKILLGWFSIDMQDINLVAYVNCFVMLVL